jgi:hypothetical protein
MAYARGFGLNGKSFFTNIKEPKEVNLSFVVASANGLGVTSVKSNGYVENVFMHTSIAPAVGNGGFTNPNPANGVLIVQLRNNFNTFLSAVTTVSSPLAGAALTSVTAASPYVITSLGTTTAAQWVAKGYPIGFTPAVGGAFIASATGAIGGTGTVKVPGVSGVLDLEMVGDPNQTISNSAIASNAGAKIIMQFLGATSSSVTTPIAAAPADGTLVGVKLYFDGSSVSVDGL